MIRQQIALSAWETISFGRSVVNRLRVKSSFVIIEAIVDSFPKCIAPESLAQHRWHDVERGTRKATRGPTDQTLLVEVVSAKRAGTTALLDCVGNFAGFATNKDVLIGEEPGQDSQTDRM